MRSFKKHLLFLLGLIIFCAPLAADDVFFDYPERDLCLTYLNFLFGPLTGTGIYLEHNSLSFAIVKILVFSISVASFLAGWALFLGTFRSATEGKFLGEKLSSTSVIVRTVVGLGLLAPDATGYAPIQRMFMSFILFGVSLANNLWGILVERYTKGDSLFSPAVEGTKTSKNQTNHLMANAVLINYLMSSQQIVDFQIERDSSDKFIQISVLPSSSPTGEYSAPLIIFEGSDGRISGEALAGVEQSMRSFSFDTMATIASQKITDLQVTGSTSDSLTRSNMTAAYDEAGIDSNLRNALVADNYAQYYTLMAKDDNTVADGMEKYLEDGWIVAGSLYWVMTQSFKPKSYTDSLQIISPTKVAPAGSFINVNDWLASVSSHFYDPGAFAGFDYQLSVTNAQSAYAGYGDDANQYSSPVSTTIDAQMAGLSFSFTSLENPFKKALDGGDPFLDFVSDCQEILKGILVFMITSLIVMVVLTLIATILKEKLPAAHTVLVALSMILFLMLSFSFIMIPGAAFGGYYLPLVPMLIFTASVISWFLKVIEAIIAAPFVAVALLQPTQDDFGRASPSVLLLLHVITKPALIMIGFILSSRIMIIALSLYSVPLNTFLQANMFPATSSNIAFQRALTMILVCDTTVAVIVALTTRAFSLIYRVPDRVFSWIGHNGSGSDVASIVKEVRSGAEQGIKMMSRIFEISTSAGKTVIEALKMAGQSEGDG